MAAKSDPSQARTRRRLLTVLKRRGAQTADALADALGVGAMAVRQHLYALQERDLIAYDEVPQALGRPAKHWRLTPAADVHFPDSHAELTVGFITAMRSAFGEAGLDRVLLERTRAQVDAYRTAIPDTAPLVQRVKRLAALRTAEGYMAEAKKAGDALLLLENHCPVCEAASACIRLCDRELELFQTVLGDGVAVTRVEHIQAGARRCAYRITPVDTGAA